MPEKQTLERARKDKREGKAPTTQAGEFVREEIHHVRAGKHGARSAKQAIAIGLAKARRAGVKLPAQGRSKPSAAPARLDARAPKSPARARAAIKALKKEPRRAASSGALSRQAKSAARRTPRRRPGKADGRRKP